jgi:hypothetical protein
MNMIAVMEKTPIWKMRGIFAPRLRIALAA